MLQIREFLFTLARLEFDSYKQNQNESIKNERDLLQEGQHKHLKAMSITGMIKNQHSDRIQTKHR